MDISQVLISTLQQFPGTASAVTIVGILGFAFCHLWCFVPAPPAGATGVWPSVYAVLNVIASNWGTNQNPPPPPTKPEPVAKGVGA